MDKLFTDVYDIDRSSIIPPLMKEVQLTPESLRRLSVGENENFKKPDSK